MTLIALVGFIALFASAALGQQQNYVDYEYQAQPIARPAQSVGLSRAAAAAVKPTPVPIIKQINRHNDDGSYTYGYEGADGSFKIETKLPTGEVAGKYGYVDDTGKLRVVDYGANRYGFQPAGDGITVAPPTLVDETTEKVRENTFAEYDEEGAFYARPQTVARPLVRQPKRPRPVPVPVAAPVPAPRPVQYAPQPQYVAYEPAPRPAPIPVQAIPQQAPAQFPQQHQQQRQQFQTEYFTYEQPRQVAPAQVPTRLTHVPAPAPAKPVVPLFRPHAVPAPVPQQVAAPVPVPVPAPRPAPVREHQGRQTGSVLDSLLQQYALPQGAGQPLHDISFGSYSSQTSF